MAKESGGGGRGNSSGGGGGRSAAGINSSTDRFMQDNYGNSAGNSALSKKAQESKETIKEIYSKMKNGILANGLTADSSTRDDIRSAIAKQLRSKFGLSNITGTARAMSDAIIEDVILTRMGK